MKRAPVDEDNDYLPVSRKRRKELNNGHNGNEHSSVLLAELEEREIMEGNPIAASPSRVLHPSSRNHIHHHHHHIHDDSRSAVGHPGYGMISSLANSGVNGSSGAYPGPPPATPNQRHSNDANTDGEYAWMEPNPIDYNSEAFFPTSSSRSSQQQQDRLRSFWAPWHPSYGDPAFFPSWIPPPSQPAPSAAYSWLNATSFANTSAPSLSYWPPSFYQQPPVPSVSNDQDQEPTSNSDTFQTQNSQEENVAGSSGTESNNSQNEGNLWHSPIQHHQERGEFIPQEEVQQGEAAQNMAMGSSSHRSTSSRMSCHQQKHMLGHPEHQAYHDGRPMYGDPQQYTPASLSATVEASNPNRTHGPQFSSSSVPLVGIDGGIPLAIPSDEEHLSEYHCLVRAQIDLFAAGEADFQSNMQGRNRPIVRNQVGLRCRHCASISPPNRRPPGAVYYPSKLSGLYQAAVNMAKNHFMVSCQRIPLDVKNRLARLKEKKTYMLGGGKGYWSTGGRIRNVIEVDNRLFFENKAPSAVSESSEGNKEN